MTKVKYIVYIEENGEKKILKETNDLRLAYYIQAMNDDSEIQYN